MSASAPLVVGFPLLVHCPVPRQLASHVPAVRREFWCRRGRPAWLRPFRRTSWSIVRWSRGDVARIPGGCALVISWRIRSQRSWSACAHRARSCRCVLSSNHPSFLRQIRIATSMRQAVHRDHVGVYWARTPCRQPWRDEFGDWRHLVATGFMSLSITRSQMDASYACRYPGVPAC